MRNRQHHGKHIACCEGLIEFFYKINKLTDILCAAVGTVGWNRHGHATRVVALVRLHYDVKWHAAIVTDLVFDVLSWRCPWYCSRCLWCCRDYTARAVCPVVFDVVMATLLVMLVLLPLVLSGQHCSWSRCSNCWFWRHWVSSWWHCSCFWFQQSWVLSRCLWCCHGYTACAVGPAAFGVFVASLLFLVSSWLHCYLCWSCCHGYTARCCWSCSLWCCQGKTARGHDAEAVGSSDIGCRHGDTARAFGFSSLGYRTSWSRCSSCWFQRH